MPDTQSQEKIDCLRSLGATVYPVPAVPFADPQNYNHQAKRYAQNRDNTIWTDQFDNVANRYGHFSTTGPEIWMQTHKSIDAFICAVPSTFIARSNLWRNVTNLLRSNTDWNRRHASWCWHVFKAKEPQNQNRTSRSSWFALRLFMHGISKSDLVYD